MEYYSYYNVSTLSLQPSCLHGKASLAHPCLYFVLVEARTEAVAVKDIRIYKYAPWSWDEAHGCNEVQVPSGTVGSPAVQQCCSCTCAEIFDACHEISSLKKWGLQYGLVQSRLVRRPAFEST